MIHWPGFEPPAAVAHPPREAAAGSLLTGGAAPAGAAGVEPRGEAPHPLGTGEASGESESGRGGHPTPAAPGPSRSAPSDPADLQDILDQVTRTTLDVDGAQARAEIGLRLRVLGFDVAYVACGVCRGPDRRRPFVMTIYSFLFGHYVQAEQAHRARTDTATPASRHRPGDVRPATDDEAEAALAAGLVMAERRRR